MRFLDLLAMSINNLRRRKLRTALTVLGVIIGTASIVIMISLGIGLNELNRELIESSGSLTTIEVRMNQGGGDESGQEPQYLNDDVISRFQRIPNVASVYPMLETQVFIQQGAYMTGTSLTGAPLEYLKQIPLAQGSVENLSGKELQLIYGNAVLQWFQNSKTNKGYWDTGVLPEIDYMGKPMFVVFDVDAFYKAQGDGAAPVPKKHMIPTAGVVVGEVSDYNEYAYSIYADIDLLKAQLRKTYKKNPIPGQPTNKKGKPLPYLVYSMVQVNVDDVKHVTEIQKQLTDMGFQAYSNVEWMEQSEKQSGMIQAVLGGIGAVSLFVAAIGIANTMMMSIYERTKEIGVIKVLGCDMGVIRDMFLLESGFIGFLGGLIGILLSYGVSLLMNQFLRIGQVITGMEGDISRIPLWLVLTSVGFAVFVGMAAGFFPALRAMRLSPLAAIRNE